MVKKYHPDLNQSGCHEKIIKLNNAYHKIMSDRIVAGTYVIAAMILNKEFTITNEWIASKSGWTPYDGLKIKGLPVFTVVNGKIVMQDSEIVLPPIGEPVLFNYD